MLCCLFGVPGAGVLKGVTLWKEKAPVPATLRADPPVVALAFGSGSVRSVRAELRADGVIIRQQVFRLGLDGVAGLAYNGFER